MAAEAAAPDAAAARFTLVIDGRIVPVETLAGVKGTWVQAAALAELARARPGTDLAVDPSSGVVSLTRGGTGSIDDRFTGFSVSTLTLVVDGKILPLPAKVAGGGARSGSAYVEPVSLKRAAEAIGFSTDLAGSVLALTGTGAGAPRSAASTETPSGGGDRAPAYGLQGSLFRHVAGAAGGARGAGGRTGDRSAPGGDGSVCAYLDSMKALWLETEPTESEKAAFQTFADLWEKARRDGRPGDPTDLQRFERALRDFDNKVKRRSEGTRRGAAPPAASEWHDAAVAFLGKVEATLATGFELIRIFHLPPEKQEAERPRSDGLLAKLKGLEVEVQSTGNRANDAVVRVRLRHGCGPP